jgi:hypothetical protein
VWELLTCWKTSALRIISVGLRGSFMIARRRLYERL